MKLCMLVFVSLRSLLATSGIFEPSNIQHLRLVRLATFHRKTGGCMPCAAWSLPSRGGWCVFCWEDSIVLIEMRAKYMLLILESWWIHFDIHTCPPAALCGQNLLDDLAKNDIYTIWSVRPCKTYSFSCHSWTYLLLPRQRPRPLLNWWVPGCKCVMYSSSMQEVVVEPMKYGESEGPNYVQWLVTVMVDDCWWGGKVGQFRWYTFFCVQCCAYYMYILTSLMSFACWKDLSDLATQKPWLNPAVLAHSFLLNFHQNEDSRRVFPIWFQYDRFWQFEHDQTLRSHTHTDIELWWTWYLVPCPFQSDTIISYDHTFMAPPCTSKNM